ncbi:pyridoxal-5'-phosphate-dependent protein subunit beta (plasmid) [Bosea vaviloviae]|uniref:Pyridoxal-5'-phosphate-dependent protein subunit beta n=1 Tax=Bosea vaviloviae TaxID=1526658 RepID=A0A1D7UCQ4_9HYPH|nr:pyridoxal-phosphate dependent enzyme [Bosea vaviloviae]AOO85158.1 pyridoxal-5'-phosphate-dependent protein subunit beta [Bosea vaviloviae]
MSLPGSGLLDSIEIVDAQARSAAIRRARARGVRLPTFSQLAGITPIPADITANLQGVDPDAPESDNLWRVNWFNAEDRRTLAGLPRHFVLPKALTGVDAPIVVMVGAHFPMIGAHKVLPAYAGLVTKLVSGRFDPERHRAVWPSTGNYCRGGVAISRILGCDGLAVLPEGMSRERFEWLERWVADPSHIIRTQGTESNVKEIYDACHTLELDDSNVILNQFSAFPNYMAHYLCTGTACGKVFENFARQAAGSRLAAFVSATGSAGTIAAGDYLKAVYGTRIAAVEALECPTLLEGGYGEHNIQGIGDKHVPLIHNVMNLDYIIGVSDQSTNALNVLFRGESNRNALRNLLGVQRSELTSFDNVGISGFANIVASIKLAKYMDFGPDDVIVTIATDGAQLYESEAAAMIETHIPEDIPQNDFHAMLRRCLHEPVADSVIETTGRDRRRVFNLGYYTWVEQQGVSVEDFDARRSQAFWKGVASSYQAWDDLIEDFNAEVALN